MRIGMFACPSECRMGLYQAFPTLGQIAKISPLLGREVARIFLPFVNFLGTLRALRENVAARKIRLAYARGVSRA